MASGLQAGVEDSFIEVDGVPVHYVRSGNGRPLLLLHGLVGSTQNWRQNIGALSSGASVYAIDLANMGRSGRVAGLDAGLEATADRVAACMDQFGFAETDVAGHSHGGAVAMMLAARHPEKVGKLILFAPANPFCDLGEGLLRFYRTSVGSGFARAIPFLPDRLKAVALRRMFGDPTRVADGTLEGYTEGLEIPGTIRHVMAVVRRWVPDMSALRAVLPALKTKPALLIWGDRDRAVGLASAEKLQQYLSNSSLVVLPSVGHIPFEEMPEACNRAVLEWLAQRS